MKWWTHFCQRIVCAPFDITHPFYEPCNYVQRTELSRHFFAYVS